MLNKRRPMKGAVVLITGAGSGIGELMARGAAQRGAAAVVLWDLNEAEARRVADDIERDGTPTFVSRIDVTDRDAVENEARKVLERFGRVDVLVNGAGVVSGKNLLDLSPRDIERTYNVNILAHYWTVQAFLPRMMERDRGVIVTVASAAGLVGVPKQTDYSASKFAAVGFTESLRAELKNLGSEVSTLLVCPYYIATGMFDGVKTKVPLLLPILKPKQVATKILNSIESGRQRLIIPPFASTILLLKALPVGVTDLVTKIFGVSSTMDEFRGRKEPAKQ